MAAQEYFLLFLTCYWLDHQIKIKEKAQKRESVATTSKAWYATIYKFFGVYYHFKLKVVVNLYIYSVK